MKILFLDIDGVLNSDASDKYFKDLGVPAPKTFEELKKVSYTRFCPVALNNLRSIFKAVPEARVVFHSTWRRYFDLSELKEMFAYHGFKKSLFKDCTLIKLSGGDKVHSINSYLSDNKKIVKYAVVDDEDLSYGKVEGHFVQTNSTVGLTSANAQAIIDLLK